MSEPLPASTIIVARDREPGIEVYMLRRSSRSSFMPDVFVFPGGRVDALDESPQALRRIVGETAPLDAAFAYAAVRETFEEAGLLFATDSIDVDASRAARTLLLSGARSFDETLDDLGTRVDANALRYFSRWITPPNEPRRFDARFFLARAPQGQVAEADTFETHDGLWISPRAALDRYANGELALIFPTIKHLERLLQFADVEAALAFAQTKAVVPVTPHVLEGRRFVLPAALENAW